MLMNFYHNHHRNTRFGYCDFVGSFGYYVCSILSACATARAIFERTLLFPRFLVLPVLILDQLVWSEGNLSVVVVLKILRMIEFE
mmetsp:Transcript_10353/g.26044  ORF Transcript_10353/g.26044 Transcript_10353/m.26044 type:complete len:85 (+) Transcript_10353:1975-2229(+)